MTKKIRLALLYGGKSGEHEVSIQTAFSVMKVLDMTRYEPIPVYISPNGNWYQGEPLTLPPESIQQLRLTEATASALPSTQEHHPDHPPVRPSIPVPSVKAAASWLDVDVVFPLLHGPNGEDGTVQGMLELAGLPYVGSGVAASAVGMDKELMKAVFAAHGLPQAAYRVYTRKKWEQMPETIAEEIIAQLGLPCFVKPANLGSSVGISKAKTKEELYAAMDLAARFDRKIIVEEFVDGREIEVAVLGNDDPIASVPGEILPSKEFYDYEAKYLDGKSTMVIPAQIPEETAEEIRRLAIHAFKAIDASGLSRVDFFLTRDKGDILINEINTLPGFTQYSMYPLLWQHSGIPYPELIDRLVHLALERHEEKQRSQIIPDQF